MLSAHKSDKDKCFVTNIILLCLLCFVSLEEDFPDPADEGSEKNNKQGQNLIAGF